MHAIFVGISINELKIVFNKKNITDCVPGGSLEFQPSGWNSRLHFLILLDGFSYFDLPLLRNAAITAIDKDKCLLPQITENNFLYIFEDFLILVTRFNKRIINSSTRESQHDAKSVLDEIQEYI